MRQPVLLSLVTAFLLSLALPVLAAPDLQELQRRIDRNGWSFEVKDTFTASLTDEERQNLRGYSPPPGYEQVLRDHLKIFPVDRDLPGNFSWYDNEGVTPVKDQGECGSCWAFAATAELESRIKIQYGQTLDLSEQQVIQCNPYGADCDGGWSNAAYFVFNTNGAVLENCYPYLDPSFASCAEEEFKPYGFISGWHSIANDELQIKTALMDGPICTAVFAGAEFEAYAGGCFDVPGGMTNHLVLIVGYDDRACDGNGAWLIKNSWGTDFGVGGYIWVQYGAASVGTAMTQLEYTEPATTFLLNGSIAASPVYADSTYTLTWNTLGDAVPEVDIWFGDGGHCHDYPVVENLPNTGSYEWIVPNQGTNRGSLVIHPSSGTRHGFDITEEYIQVIGHRTRYVSSTGGNTAPYLTPATAARDINDAVAACTGTDTVLVAGGTYIGTVAVGTTVKLVAGFDDDFSVCDPVAFPTVITSGSSGMRFYPDSGTFGGADGFIFRNCTGGNTPDPVTGQHGGGVYVKGASPTIANCLFENNQAAYSLGTGFGGAVCVVGGNPHFVNCTMTGNRASNGGAVGVFAGASARFSDCRITANTCSDSLPTFTGAGVYVDGAEILLEGGTVTGNGGSGHGGGLHLSNAQATLDAVEVRGNRTLGNGGGINAHASELTLRRATLVENLSYAGSGGAVYSDSTFHDFRNTLVRGNSCQSNGGGLYGFVFGGLLENCVVHDNSASSNGGMMVYSSENEVLLRNNIVTGNTGGGITAMGNNLVTTSNNAWNNTGGDWLFTTPGAGDLSLDPLFVDAEGGDFGLAQYSPCIDRGADDPGCLDPDFGRADMGLHGGPEALAVAPDRVLGAELTSLGAGQWRLDWAASEAPDVDHYVVYRDTMQDFLPSAAKAVATVAHPANTYQDTPPFACYYLVVAVDAAGHSGGYSDRVYTEPDISGVEDDNQLPRSLALTAVVPNPFNPATTISFDVPRSGRVRLAVFDIRGRMVSRLVDEVRPAGRHSVRWNGRDQRGHAVSAGVYFARLEDGRQVSTSKMVLAK